MKKNHVFAILIAVVAIVFTSCTQQKYNLPHDKKVRAINLNGNIHTIVMGWTSNNIHVGDTTWMACAEHDSCDGFFRGVVVE